MKKLLSILLCLTFTLSTTITALGAEELDIKILGGDECASVGESFYSDGLRRIIEYGSMSYIDKTGKIVLKVTGKTSFDFENGIAIFLTPDGIYNLMDKKGKTIHTFKKGEALAGLVNGYV